MANPRIEIKKSALDFFFDVLSMGAVLLSWIFVVLYYKELPSMVPSHFNIYGEVDGMGSRDTVFAPAIISSIAFFMLAAFARFPHFHNYLIKITEENAARQYHNSALLMRTMNVLITGSMCYLEYKIVSISFVENADIPTFIIPTFIFVMILVPVFFLVRSRMIR